MVKNVLASAGDVRDSDVVPGSGPLEKEMSNHSNIFAWRIPQRSLAGYSPYGCKELKQLST